MKKVWASNQNSLTFFSSNESFLTCTQCLAFKFFTKEHLIKNNTIQHPMFPQLSRRRLYNKREKMTQGQTKSKRWQAPTKGWEQEREVLGRRHQTMEEVRRRGCKIKPRFYVLWRGKEKNEATESQGGSAQLSYECSKRHVSMGWIEMSSPNEAITVRIPIDIIWEMKPIFVGWERRTSLGPSGKVWYSTISPKPSNPCSPPLTCGTLTHETLITNFMYVQTTTFTFATSAKGVLRVKMPIVCARAERGELEKRTHQREFRWGEFRRGSEC